MELGFTDAGAVVGSATLGTFEGLTVGCLEGSTEGIRDGWNDGLLDGWFGVREGCIVGSVLGEVTILGSTLGILLGGKLGTHDNGALVLL